MYVPITSEITIKRGMVLREISTDELFEVVAREKNSAEVSGEDVWEIIPLNPADRDGIPLALARQALSEKYFAEMDD